MTAEPFNARQWAEDHQRHDDERHDHMDRSISNLWRIVGFSVAVIVAMLGWSLQAQYATSQRQIDALQAVQAELRVSKPPA